MKEIEKTDWHELSEQEAVLLLESDRAKGLTTTEVEARLRQFGRNEMTARKRMSEWMRFLLQFAQPLMYILLIASGVTLALGEYVDSAVIFGVTFVNAIVGFLQESKAEKAIEALSQHGPHRGHRAARRAKASRQFRGTRARRHRAAPVRRQGAGGFAPAACAESAGG